MFKILVVGLREGKNLGDVIINDTTEYLVKKVLADIHCKEYIVDCMDMTTEQYDCIPTYNLIIFAGGGIIKYKYQNFFYYIDKITVIANQYSIPVIFNAVGVEGYDEEDERCKTLIKAINRNCVKQITTRDDVNLLREGYISNPSIRCYKVADPAVWVQEVYQVQKEVKSEIIGLGVVREGIFRSNGIDIGLEEQLVLWKEIIAKLEESNIEWKIFTTGWPSDMKFACNLMKYLDREDEIQERVCKEPGTPLELVKLISGFKGVIAGRLHANIVSYALKVPSIGLVWNEKCAFWGEIIGYPNRFFRHTQFNGSNMVEECKNALKKGYYEDRREAFKMTAYHSLKEAVLTLI